MNNSAKSKRLDKIELQLTPKQWAIRLADEIRRYPSLEALTKVIAKGTYRESPFKAPFYCLEEQAKECWPKDARREFELSNRLRMEFQALKSLIIRINEEMLIKAERNRLRMQLLASKLKNLMYKGVFALSGFPEVLKESSASLARLRHSSLLDDWANDSSALFKETLADKAAVQTVQENYFESHPILYEDIETAVELTIQSVREAIVGFNDYRKDQADLTNQVSDQEQQKTGIANAMPFEPENGLQIDIEALEKGDEMLVQSIVEKWIMNARVTGIADILKETGKHEDFLWKDLRKNMGLES